MLSMLSKQKRGEVNKKVILMSLVYQLLVHSSKDHIEMIEDIIAEQNMFAFFGSCAIVLLALFVIVSKRQKTTIPGPRPIPVLGSLHLLAQYPSPFESMTALSRIYGPIYEIQLGSAQCVIVSSYNLIKEVLLTKGSHFGGRPDFIRFNKLFGGNRNNSLALCDWSDLQKTRRSIARLYCSPRFTSFNYQKLSEVATLELQDFQFQLTQRNLQNLELKPLIMAACANMFTGYMCSTRFSYEDKGFLHMVHVFDEIFWEINQGYAVDFMPWLNIFYTRHMSKLATWSTDIRQFILSRIIEKHRSNLDLNKAPRDFTEALLMHLEQDSTLEWEHIIYELEDFIGGHSAIGNLVMLALGYIVRNPHVGKRIQEEINTATNGRREVVLTDKSQMPYTEAVILETLRITSSPIVPHVASEDTSIGGHQISKGVVVFLNNYELNSGESYWENPSAFDPERFIVDGAIKKPQHFIPFSTGKRTCIGQRLVQGFSFVLLASILQHYDIDSAPEGVITYPACVALPPKTFKLNLRRRASVTVSTDELRGTEA